MAAGWKVDPWGDRYYDGPQTANDGTMAVEGDGWPGADLEPLWRRLVRHLRTVGVLPKRGRRPGR